MAGRSVKFALSTAKQIEADLAEGLSTFLPLPLGEGRSAGVHEAGPLDRSPPTTPNTKLLAVETSSSIVFMVI